MTPQKLVSLAFGLSFWSSVQGSTCTVDERCLEDIADDSSFIQKDIRLAKDESIAMLGLSHTQAGGLVSIHISDRPTAGVPHPVLGERVVDFSMSLFVPFLSFWIAVFLHERYVSYNNEIMLSYEPLQRKSCQVMTTWLGLAGFMMNAMMVPLSLDLAFSLGQSATASGLFVGVQLVAGIVGTLLGRLLVNELEWAQFFVRRVLIFIFWFLSFAALANACFYNWTAQSSQVNLIWWIAIGYNSMLNLIAAIPGVMCVVLWTKVTHPGNRTMWTFIGQCSRNAGMTIGPLAFLLVSRMVVRGGEPVNPRSMMAWVCVFSAVLNLMSLMIAVFGIPTELPHALPEALSEEGSFQLSGEARPEDLDDSGRQTVYWKIVLYFCERPLTLAAIEVSTTMMLELLYGWDAYHSGFCFTIMCPVGIVLAIVLKSLINAGIVREPNVYFGSMVVSVVGCALLFDEGNAGPTTLIAAGTMIYTGAACANGIADGWGSRAAKEGTGFGQAQFQLLKMLAISLARFTGDFLGRFLVDYGGRNMYAAFQLLLCLAGAHTAYGACRPLWAKEREGESGETLENEEAESTKGTSGRKLLQAPEDSPNPSEASPMQR